MNNPATFTYFAATCLILVSATRADEVQSVDFSRDIQPLLARHCLLCHGPDDAEAGLRLDLAEQASQKLESGNRAIVPGKAAASELLKRVTTSDESERMPPEGDSLTPEEVARLRQWINDGAEFERHWAYRPVENPPLPAFKKSDWVRSPIDRFVLARLHSVGVAPSPEADRATLIRRLYYDLIGLPPTPGEVDQFVTDESPQAYDLLVERLLASKHFGERWGRHWLDKARYADSDGYEKDRPRPNAWRYRDWVIDAVNQDMPFDQFTIEQLAGDLLEAPTDIQKLATAFHRQTLTNTEGGTDQEQFRVEATFDRTETTAAIWMALTMTCARCHSHKYDQISQHEYYQLFAFFNSTRESNIDVPKSEEALIQYEKQKAIHEDQLASLQQKYASARDSLTPQIETWTQEMTARLASNSSPVEFRVVNPVESNLKSGAKLTEQEDGSLLVSGPVSDKDEYTLVFEAPSEPLTGIRIETLTDDSLGKKGPGRTSHGNFVLSEIRAYVSNEQSFKKSTKVEFSSAEADFAQSKFAPEGALSSKAGSGWAISPQMGKKHEITVFTAKPVELQSDGPKFVQVVLDQQYGSKHTIGRFRVSLMSGFDPLRSLPKTVADAVKVEPAKRTKAHREAIANHVALQHQETADLSRQIDDLKKKAPASPLMKVRVLLPTDRTTKLLRRGDFLQPEDEVRTDAISVIESIHPLKSRHSNKPADRLDLAHWLIDESHPLTPRVTVNHVWSRLFGRGIVGTVNDFGVRGELPTHPKLLDWLAWQLPRDLKWSRKALIRTIVQSATYRQSSNHRPELVSRDPTNLWLARQNRVRVEAEIVRDLYLSVSGLFSPIVGGPSVFPPLPPGVAELSYANNFRWATSKDENRYRRGMYTFFKRTSPHPNLVSFDCPDSNTTNLIRSSSNTPLQALVTLNNEVFTESAQAMARRVLTDGGTTDVDRLIYAIRLCVSRQPATSEIERFRQLLVAAKAYYKDNSEHAAQVTSRHKAEGISVDENAAWVATLRIILNLDEFIVRS